MPNVNGLRVTGAAASSPPEVSAVGSDTNIDIKLTPKGSGDVYSTSDVDVGGGYRQTVDGWYQDNVAASQTNVTMTRQSSVAFPTKFIVPRAGSVTGVGVKANAACVAGTLTVEVFVGTVATGLSATIDTTNTTFKATTQAKDTDAFVAGDELEVKISSSTAWSPTTADVKAFLEIET